MPELMIKDMNVEDMCYQLRRRFIELFSKPGFGHLTSAFSLTEILVILYGKIMSYDILNPDWKYRDRFVLSKGHGAGMLIPVFEEFGLMNGDEINNSLKIGGDLSKFKSLFYPGFNFSGGSLGIGLGMACGLAKGAKLNRENWMTFCVVGDAECYEGAIWEAAMFAGHQHLNNLVAIIDRNYMGCSDFTENMLSLEPFKDKWLACNWDVREVDGHDGLALYQALKDVRTRRSRNPLCIIADTTKGHGIGYLENIPLMHGYMPHMPDEVEKAYTALKK